MQVTSLHANTGDDDFAEIYFDCKRTMVSLRYISIAEFRETSLFPAAINDRQFKA